MSGPGLPVTLVSACLREGRGGSPTAVLDDAPLADDERRRLPDLMGTSHAVFVTVNDSGSAGLDASLRFFTSAGELPACGHGTVAALAFLAERGGDQEHEITLRAAGRVFTGRVVRGNAGFEALFDPGPVTLREPSAHDLDRVLSSLGVSSDILVPGSCVATLGRPRLLVPVADRGALAALAPDSDRLRDACDRLGLLGCYVYSAPTTGGRAAARMFAPSIGVPEDIANANSTACLAARLAREGTTRITVDMGDALGSPSTISAVAQRDGAGTRVHVGGTAVVGGVTHLGGAANLVRGPAEVSCGADQLPKACSSHRE